MKDPTSFVKKKLRKQHRKQRADRGWSEWDFWNFHDYHSWMMISVLERFKSGAGYPVDERVKSMDDWIVVLDEMIDGFKASIEMSNMDSYKPSKQEYKEWQAPLLLAHSRGMELFSKYYLSLWD